jgi:hypothetical protein
MRPRIFGNGTLTPRVPDWFTALMAALQLRGANNQALVELGDEDWKELLEFGDLAHVTLSLSALTQTGFPAWVDERLKANAADNDWRFDRVRATYVEAEAALRNAGVEFLVLKGFSQSPDFVTNPRLRMQSDLDLYCPQEQIAAAVKALEALGYASAGAFGNYRNADHVPALSRTEDWVWRGNAYDPVMPLSIELHFCLWNERVFLISVPEVQKFWGRRVDRKIEDFSFPSLHPIDQLAYFALHIVRGAISGDWIVHHVREMAMFLHSQSQNVHFWREWSKEYSREFRNMQAIAFSLADRWFSCNLPDAVREQIKALPPAQHAWLEKFGASSIENMFYKNRDWVWLHVAIVRSPGKKRAVLRRATIPSRIPGLDGPVLCINRKTVRDGSNPYSGYVSYVLKRMASHASMIPRLLWHGAQLWFSQRTLRGQF